MRTFAEMCPLLNGALTSCLIFRLPVCDASLKAAVTHDARASEPEVHLLFLKMIQTYRPQSSLPPERSSPFTGDRAAWPGRQALGSGQLAGVPDPCSSGSPVCGTLFPAQLRHPHISSQVCKSYVRSIFPAARPPPVAQW